MPDADDWAVSLPGSCHPDHTLVLELGHLAGAHTQGLHRVDRPRLLAGSVHGQVEARHPI